MAGHVYNVVMVDMEGLWTADAWKVYVPQDKVQDALAYFVRMEQGRERFRFQYLYSHYVTRKPRGMALYSD